MSFDLSSWLWWRLVSLVVVVLMWLLLAFGVAATPAPAAAYSPAAQLTSEAAGQSSAVEPCEGRFEGTARRFEPRIAMQSEFSISVPRLQGGTR
jgi:hypothetical protein